MKKTLTALVLCSAMFCAMGIQGFAVDAGVQTHASSSIQQAQSLPDSILYFGQVEKVEKDEQGIITSLIMGSEHYGAYILNISPETVWIDSGNHSRDDPSDLAVGEALYAFHSPLSTKSTPPQSAAFAIVRNVPQDASCAHYHVVEAVSKGENGTYSITTDNGGLIISAGKATNVAAYSCVEIPSLESLQAGDRIMAWYDIVLTSYPGQTYANHILTLPKKSAAETDLPQEGGQLTMELNGRVPNMVGRYESGVAMVPLAAVAQALGFEVTYTSNTEQGPLVTVESDVFAVYLYINQNLIFGSTKIPGAVGMTGPQDYGKAAYIASPGTTWAPAELFQMLGKTVTLEGSNLVIR